MGLAPGSLTKVCHAPLEWYRSISTVDAGAILVVGLLSVRTNKLRGIISGHVDDFLFSGSSSDDIWLSVEKAIKEEFP